MCVLLVVFVMLALPLLLIRLPSLLSFPLPPAQVLSLLRASLKTLKNTVKKRKKRGKKKKKNKQNHVGEEKLEEQGDP